MRWSVLQLEPVSSSDQERKGNRQSTKTADNYNNDNSDHSDDNDGRDIVASMNK